MKGFLKSNAWAVAGCILLGIGSFCFAKAGEVEYISRHVWEEADRVNQKAADTGQPDARETER